MLAILSLFFALVFGSANGATFTISTSPVTEPKPVTVKGDRNIDRLPPLPQK